MSGIFGIHGFPVYNKVDFGAIDVRFISSKEVPIYVHDRLKKIRTEKEKIESSKQDDVIVSNTVMVEALESDIDAIVQECQDFNLYSKHSGILIYYIN